MKTLAVAASHTSRLVLNPWTWKLRRLSNKQERIVLFSKVLLDVKYGPTMSNPLVRSHQKNCMMYEVCYVLASHSISWYLSCRDARSSGDMASPMIIWHHEFHIKQQTTLTLSNINTPSPWGRGLPSDTLWSLNSSNCHFSSAIQNSEAPDHVEREHWRKRQERRVGREE